MHEAELSRLDKIAAASRYTEFIKANSIDHAFTVFKRYMDKPGEILELGPAEGLMTDHLVKLGMPLTAVDGAETFCAALRKRHPKIAVETSLLEEYVPSGKFDYIVLGHVLEHVENPISILRRVSTWMSDRGKILASVPNARSIHRQAAVIMGLLHFEEQLNEADLHHGHRRVYNPETFRRDFISAGLDIEVFGGFWLKPLSNSQIESSWSKKMVSSFMQLGERYPDIAGELYIIASSRNSGAMDDTQSSA